VRAEAGRDTGALVVARNYKELYKKLVFLRF
jgi:hypothetical protein